MQTYNGKALYFETKQTLNDLLNKVLAEGITQEEAVYQIAKAADDLFAVKHAALLYRERNEVPED